MHQGKDYWKNYMLKWFGSGLIDDWSRYCQEVTIRSNDEDLHLETYIAAKDRPALVFSHGIAGYARVLLPFVMPLFRLGVNIICPDLKGYGYNAHRKGDFTWNHHVANLIDTVKYVKNVCSGPVFLGGASMGGPLAYEAASRVDGIAGLVCWCLWDLSDREYIENETSMKRMTYPLMPFLKLADLAAGFVRIKTHAIVSYDTLTAVPEFNAMIKSDPQAGTLISIRGALSLVLQSKPGLAYEKWKKPIIVFQPGDDAMTPPGYIKKAFSRIGSDDKEYIELPGSAHFPVENKYYQLWTDKAYAFISRVASGCGMHD